VEKKTQKEDKRDGGGEGRRLTCGGSRCCWRRWRWQDATAGVGGDASDDGSHRFFPCFFFYSSSFFFFFLSRFSPLYPYSAPLFFLSIPLFLSYSPFPCFYRQKTGERENGRPLRYRPSNKWKALGCVSVFLNGSRRLLKGKMVVTDEEKIFFFPSFARPVEEEDPQCLKRHRLGPSFLMNSV